MLHLTLYGGFAKRENSTKQPSSGITMGVTGILKEPCPLMNPIIVIHRLANDIIPSGFTYAYWTETGKYYFVEDWIWVNGLWEVHLKVDVLASYKTEIGNLSEYILRTDSTTDFNGDITDTTYPATCDTETETVLSNNAFTSTITSGCYIVGIISGGSTEAVGAITYYIMTSAQFGSLKDKLFSDDNLQIMGIIDAQGRALVEDLSQEVLKTLYNPYQYIASCMWFPFPTTLVTDKTSVSSIKIGWWDYPLSGDRLYAQTVEVAEQAIQFTAHPQAATRGNYLNYAPYSKRTLVGRFGTVALDSACFKDGDSIDVSYVVDLITGQCRAQIGRMRNSAYDLLADRQFLIGVPIQIAQVGTDYLGTAVSAINTTANTIGKAFSLDFSGAITSAASGIYNTLQSAMPQVETGGSNGSFLSAGFVTHIVTQFYKIVDEDISHRGRPLCEIRTINTLAGYVLCASGDIEISCYDNERKEIQRYLTTGFFWE